MIHIFKLGVNDQYYFVGFLDVIWQKKKIGVGGGSWSYLWGGGGN